MKQINTTKRTYVSVLSKNGEILEPTTRCGHVRFLLKQGKARVVRNKPFTIQLLYATNHITQGETLAIDPGRTNIGISTVKEGTGECTLLADIQTRNKDIPGLMKARKEYRCKHRDMGRRDVRQRRAKKHGTTVHTKDKTIERILPHYQKPVVCHYIRNKEAKYCNRVRKKGWLTPTARHLLETHLQVIRTVMGIRPITKIALEVNIFDFVAMDQKNIQKSMYGHGPLFGTGGLHQAVSMQQDGKCLLCKKRDIEHYHHIIPRRKRGSDTIANIAGLCQKCHDRVHKDIKAEQRLSKRKKGMNKRYHVLSVINQIIPYLVNAIKTEFPNIELILTYGWQTKEFRDNNHIPKDHCLDAYCIAGCATQMSDIDRHLQNVKVEQIRQFRRQDRQACHKEMLSRKYYLDGVLVATNRHKAVEQKTDSLEEFRKVATAQDITRLTVKDHQPVYKDTKRVLPGAVVQCDTRKFVLLLTEGKHKGIPNYMVSVDGMKYPYQKCSVIVKNKGLVWL